jgi:uncharacterized membrane protein YfcA
MDAQNRSETREYAWRYFALHADQRLKTFNFFLILVTVILGGAFTLAKDAKAPLLVGFAVTILLPLLSFVFSKLDRRNQELIHHSESILRDIEKDIPETEIPAQLRLSTQEQIQTDHERKTRKLGLSPTSWLKAHFRYSTCFGCTFWIIGILGPVFGVGSLFLVPAKDVPAPIPQQLFHGTQPANVTPQMPARGG